MRRAAAAAFLSVLALLCLCRNCSGAEVEVTAGGAATATAAVEEEHAHYGKPPCHPNETRAEVFGRVVCTTRCSNKTWPPCPVPPANVFGRPFCILEGKIDRLMYCGILCTAHSYCPKGSKCTKVKANSMGAIVEDDEVFAKLMNESTDGKKGVCTYKPKAKKEAAKTGKSNEVLELNFVHILAEEFFDMKPLQGMNPPAETGGGGGKKKPRAPPGTLPGVGPHQPDPTYEDMKHIERPPEPYEPEPPSEEQLREQRRQQELMEDQAEEAKEKLQKSGKKPPRDTRNDARNERRVKNPYGPRDEF